MSNTLTIDNQVFYVMEKNPLSLLIGKDARLPRRVQLVNYKMNLTFRSIS